MEAPVQKKMDAVSYARRERRYFYYHLGLFMIAQLVLAVLFGWKGIYGSYEETLKDWFLHKEDGLFENTTVNTYAFYWKNVVVGHGLWAFSYLIFPKKDATRTEKRKQTNRTIVDHLKKVPLTEGRAWGYVALSGLIEIYWVSCLKEDAFTLLPLLALFVSFELLIKAVRVLPVGTAYATFTGIGTVGTIVVDLLFFHEPFHLVKMVLVLMLGGFIVGLKLTSDRKERVK
ncbi:SugE protein [Fictibacillus macauensis ZFHKF-1]|uniref:SugE protein n=1 Tax=Fictibacillus macauensis ZFHKF-1 TaxID=1196324 RepID=I8IY87_9BACL|nr:multidrug efflux SMR transporter [Fictibacillus macauensis]EIT84441.1 SugE protein [Fictibacillus macauensis ZFHKF-1]